MHNILPEKTVKLLLNILQPKNVFLHISKHSSERVPVENVNWMPVCVFYPW